jgi:hypothetical protein
VPAPANGDGDGREAPIDEEQALKEKLMASELPCQRRRASQPGAAEDEELLLKQKLMAAALPSQRQRAAPQAGSDSAEDEESLMKELVLRNQLLRKHSTPANQSAQPQAQGTGEAAANCEAGGEERFGADWSVLPALYTPSPEKAQRSPDDEDAVCGREPSLASPRLTLRDTSYGGGLLVMQDEDYPDEGQAVGAERQRMREAADKRPECMCDGRCGGQDEGWLVR